MAKLYYGAIDIGSNAVRLLVKSVNPNTPEAEPQKEQLFRLPLRLGIDAFTKGKIGQKKSKKLLQLMKSYKMLMSIYDVEDYRACATSAMRDAKNGQELVQKIEEKTGIQIEIIDGKEEARLISTDLLGNFEEAKEKVFLYVDVGGGSTELNLIQKGKLISSESFNIGTVRTLSGMVTYEERIRFKEYLNQIALEHPKVEIVGTGGNINKLLRLSDDYTKGENIGQLSIKELDRIYKIINSYSVEDRIDLLNLKPDRADVIIPASEIFLDVAQATSAECVIVPTKGLADGIIDALLKRADEA